MSIREFVAGEDVASSAMIAERRKQLEVFNKSVDLHRDLIKTISHYRSLLPQYMQDELNVLGESLAKLERVEAGVYCHLAGKCKDFKLEFKLHPSFDVSMLRYSANKRYLSGLLKLDYDLRKIDQDMMEQHIKQQQDNTNDNIDDSQNDNSQNDDSQYDDSQYDIDTDDVVKRVLQRINNNNN